MGQRGGGGGRSFSSAPYQTETGIFRNFYGNSHWSASLIVQLASLVGWVKLSNLSMWGINVSHGSLIVSIGHVGVDMQYCSTRYALGGIITMHLLLAPSFQEARASMAEYISISYNSFQKITLFSWNLHCISFSLYCSGNPFRLYTSKLTSCKYLLSLHIPQLKFF